MIVGNTSNSFGNVVSIPMLSRMSQSEHASNWLKNMFLRDYTLLYMLALKHIVS